MKGSPFDKEAANYESGTTDTPYARARQEWDERLGTVRAQSRNWRLIAFACAIISILLLVILILVLELRQDRVYVAEVNHGGRVVNIAPLEKPYHPKKAQKEYFISHFIKLTRAIPLDPVVAKNNWLQAYNFLTRRSAKTFNKMMTQDNMTHALGKKTREIKIKDINAMSNNTFQVDWIEETTKLQDNSQSKQHYSGVFTLVTKPPKTQKQILQNPLGIHIAHFNVSKRD